MHSDEELVAAARNGDRAAFGALVERYERPVRSVAIAVLRNADSAQDVTQDTFLTAFKKLSALRNRSAFGPWVLRIAKRCACRAARSRQRNPLLVDPNDVVTAPSKDKLSDRLETLLQAVVGLPEQERVVIMLRYFEDQSVESIANSTGRSVGTVTKQLSRARSRLKSRLETIHDAR